MSFWERAARVIEWAVKVTGWIGALAILAAALIVTEGVVIRKVFDMSTVWQIEMSIFLLMYACFVGAALTQQHEHHLNVDLFIIHLRPKNRELVLLAAAIISAAIAAVMAYYAWPMWLDAWEANEHSETLWGPAMWIPYLFLPLGMSLLFLQYVVQIIRKIHDIRHGRIEQEAIRGELKEIDIPTGEGTLGGDNG